MQPGRPVIFLDFDQEREASMSEPNNYDDIADLYDIYVPVTFDIPFFLGEARKSPGEVLELMAGTGRVSIPLIEAGVKLTCVDMAGKLLAILKDKLERKGLKAELHQMDVRELDLSRQFDLIIIPFHSFAHIVSPDDQRKALERIRQHLSPGGRFICTLGNPAIRGKEVDGKLRLYTRYTLPDDRGALLLWLLENYNTEDDHIVENLQFFEEYDNKGVLQAKRLLELRFRLSTKDEFESLARSAGFHATALYGDYSYSKFEEDTSPYMVWVFSHADV